MEPITLYTIADAYIESLGTTDIEHTKDNLEGYVEGVYEICLAVEDIDLIDDAVRAWLAYEGSEGQDQYYQRVKKPLCDLEVTQ